MTREQHLIADCRYRAGDWHADCTCGFRVDGTSPESVRAQFSAHRYAMGKRNHGGNLSLTPQVRVKPRVGRKVPAGEWVPW